MKKTTCKEFVSRLRLLPGSCGLLLILVLQSFLLSSCDQVLNEDVDEQTYADVKVVGAMRNVMWKGELDGNVSLDSLTKDGIYGLGPEEYLTGELLVADGQVFVSRVRSDSLMEVTEVAAVKAPFFVYSTINKWQEKELPDTVKSISDLEKYLDMQTSEAKRPFAFRLTGTVESANIHVQNLPPGTTVSSPKEAHQGQVNYTLSSEEVEIIGFFSTEHKGVFTHHDSFLHMHLITKDKEKMGHLDAVMFDQIKVYLPMK